MKEFLQSAEQKIEKNDEVILFVGVQCKPLEKRDDFIL